MMAPSLQDQPLGNLINLVKLGPVPGRTWKGHRTLTLLEGGFSGASAGSAGTCTVAEAVAQASTGLGLG